MRLFLSADIPISPSSFPSTEKPTDDDQQQPQQGRLGAGRAQQHDPPQQPAVQQLAVAVEIDGGQTRRAQELLELGRRVGWVANLPLSQSRRPLDFKRADKKDGKSRPPTTVPRSSWAGSPPAGCA